MKKITITSIDENENIVYAHYEGDTLVRAFDRNGMDRWVGKFEVGETLTLRAPRTQVNSESYESNMLAESATEKIGKVWKYHFGQFGEWTGTFETQDEADDALYNIIYGI